MPADRSITDSLSASITTVAGAMPGADDDGRFVVDDGGEWIEQRRVGGQLHEGVGPTLLRILHGPIEADSATKVFIPVLAKVGPAVHLGAECGADEFHPTLAKDGFGCQLGQLGLQ